MHRLCGTGFSVLVWIFTSPEAAGSAREPHGGAVWGARC